MIYTQAKKAITRHRTLSKCELLAEIIDSEANLDSLSYFPYLLAWDLAQVSAPRPQAAVFIDTFEAISSEDRNFECLLQRSVFLMPNVLFVITGRNRLDWADLTSTEELDYVGTDRWPNLHAGHTDSDPRQHLVGYLSMSDANSYLETALTDNDSPAIPETIRNRIATASGGLPLYLDLAVNEFLDVLARNQAPRAEDFGQPLGSVVSRLLRDLDQNERQLLRAAALVDAFNINLLRAACPHIPDAVYRRFRDRPFLELDEERPWPYSLHQILRDNIRLADAGLRDSWSDRERAEVASRIANYLEIVATTASTNRDRATEIAAFRLTIELSIRTEMFFPWTIVAAQRLLTSGSWDLYVQPSSTNDAVNALLTGLRGARERRAGDVMKSLDLLNVALDRPGLPRELHDFLTLHRAHALRVAGRYDEAAQDYATLADTEGEVPVEAIYWLTDYKYLSGQFGDALSAMDELAPLSRRLEAEHLDGEVLRLRGHVFRVNAMLVEAEQCYRHALTLAEATSNLAAEGKALTDLVQTLSWSRPEEALALVPAARQANQDIDNQIEIVKIHAATAVAYCRLGQLELASNCIERGLVLTDACGYPGGTVWCLTARALLHLASGNEPGYNETANDIFVFTSNLGGNRFWADIVIFWTNGSHELPGRGSRADWLGGMEAARARWQEVAMQPLFKDGAPRA